MPRPAPCAAPGTAALTSLAGRPRFHRALWSDETHPCARPVRLVHLPDLPFRVCPATAVELQRAEASLVLFLGNRECFENQSRKFAERTEGSAWWPLLRPGEAAAVSSE